MRDIKFRAWNMRTQSWIYFGVEGIPKEIENDIDYTLVQQYIERKDKNRKEIYEGDIVLENTSGIRKSWACKEVISWDEKRSGFAPFCLPRYNSDQYCEVIGNIYENPELLEAK